nr:MAG TPA: hypothetical protein [Caudoviricetes sp.]
MLTLALTQTYASLFYFLSRHIPLLMKIEVDFSIRFFKIYTPTCKRYG